LTPLPASGTQPAPQESAQARLGERLFFDATLSADGTVRCATCHLPERAFTDGKPTAVGVAGRGATRNTPSLIDVAVRSSLTWDGRETRLETQVLRPFTQSREHGLRDADQLLDKIRRNHAYREALAAAFDTGNVTLPQVAAALAVYLRTFSSGSSAYDRFVAGDAGALTESARRGLELFRGAAGCAECHHIAGRHAAFTDENFHRVGVGLPTIASRLPELTARVAASSADQIDTWVFEDRDVAALGRFLVTRDPRDIGAYRTPSLRNVAVTAPYMHDGSVATLGEAVKLEVYYRVQERGRPLALSLADQADLVEFLIALTDAPYVSVTAPARPSTTGAGSDGVKRSSRTQRR
jgi:cytochrome c peroxidase